MHFDPPFKSAPQHEVESELRSQICPSSDYALLANPDPAIPCIRPYVIPHSNPAFGKPVQIMSDSLLRKY